MSYITYNIINIIQNHLPGGREALFSALCVLLQESTAHFELLVDVFLTIPATETPPLPLCRT